MRCFFWVYLICLSLFLILGRAGLAAEAEPAPGDTPLGDDESIAGDEEVIVLGKAIELQTTTLSEDQVRVSAGMSVADLLEEIPGVDSIRTAQGTPEPVLRGLAGERVRIRVGAVPLFGACPSRMDPPLVYMMPQNSGPVRLELGTGSMTGGPAGMGGRVQIRPDWSRPAGMDDQVIGSGTLVFAADGLRTRLGASTELAQGPFDGRVSFDLGRGGEYRSGSGAKVPANHEHVGASLSLAGQAWENQRLFATVSFVRETDVDHPALPMDNDLTDAWIANLGYRWSGQGMLRALELEAGFSRLDHTMSNRGRPNRTVLDARTPSTSWTVAGSGLMRLQALDNLSLSLGLDFYQLARDATRSRTVLASGLTFQDHIWPDASEWDTGALAEANWLIAPEWVLVLGGRFDLVGGRSEALGDPSLQGLTVAQQFERLYGSDGSDAKAWNLAGAARASLTWLPHGHVAVFFEAGFTGRAPSITERFFAFAPAPGGFQVGNPTLDVEKKISLETGVRLRSTFVDLDFTAFGYRIADFILRTVIERQDVNGDGEQDAVFGFNNRLALLAGGELSLRPKPLPWLSIPLSLVSVTGWNLTEDRWLAEIPPLSGRAGVRIERRDAVPWWVEASLRVAAAQTFIDARVGELRSPAHQVLDLRAGVEPWSWLRLQVGLLNLTDADYSPHLNRTLPMPAGDLPAGARIPAPGFSGYLVASGRY